MLNDEKEPHIRRAVFLPMYYTVISLMVIKCFILRLNLYNPTYFQIPLSLWAAWGIYSQPIRYRSLFPHNEARKQAIAGAGITKDVQCNEQCSFYSISLNFSLSPHGPILPPLLPDLGKPQGAAAAGRSLCLPHRARDSGICEARSSAAADIRHKTQEKIAVGLHKDYPHFLLNFSFP